MDTLSDDKPLRNQGHIRSYVLRQARLTRAQERAYDNEGAQFLIPWAENTIDFASFFGNANPVICEIGFGMGHATAEIARANPQFNYLGVEVHKPGVGALIERIIEYGLTNIRIVHHDVVPVLNTRISKNSLAGVHIFFPDPWQKKRHHKRRLIQKLFLDSLAERCMPGAYLYLATDWQDYAEWMLQEISQSSYWRNQNKDYSPPIPWRPLTAFERKGLDKQHVIREIYSLKRLDEA